MDSFLDTCIIISYWDKKDKINLAVIKFIDSGKNFIMSVYQDKREIPFLFFRKNKVICEAIKFSAWSSYLPNLDKLTLKDEINLKKMVAKIKIGELSQQELFLLQKEIQLLKQKINYFVKNKITRKVISLERIDLDLVDLLKKQIKNSADCFIISSAIQEHAENKLEVITNDKKDWSKERIKEAIKQTKYRESPEIKFLQDS